MDYVLRNLENGISQWQTKPPTCQNRQESDLAAPNERSSGGSTANFRNLIEVSFRMDWKINRLRFAMHGS
jgi:hypothetical protein